MFNKPLRILIISSTIATFVFGVIVPFYAIFIDRLGLSTAFAGFSWAVLHIVCGLLIFFLKKFELSINDKRKLLAAGYFIRSMVFISYANLFSITQLVLSQILWGLGAALSIPAFEALYSSHLDKNKSIAQWGGLSGWSQIAMGLSAIVGGIAIDVIGFKPVFYSMSVMLFLLGVYILSVPKNTL